MNPVGPREGVDLGPDPVERPSPAGPLLERLREGSDGFLESDGARLALANDSRRAAGTVLRLGLLKPHVKRHSSDAGDASLSLSDLRSGSPGQTCGSLRPRSGQQSCLTLRMRQLVIILDISFRLLA